MALDVREAVAGVELIPAAVEVFGDQAELDDQTPDSSTAAASPRFLRHRRISAFSSLAHDDSGVGAPYKLAPKRNLQTKNHRGVFNAGNVRSEIAFG